MRIISRHFSYPTAFESNVTIDLCAKHDNNDAVGRPLGEVSHGLHYGSCFICAQNRQEEEEEQ